MSKKKKLLLITITAIFILIFACCNCGKISDGKVLMFFGEGIFKLGTTSEKVTEEEFLETMFRQATPKTRFIDDFQGIVFDTWNYKTYYLRYEVDNVQELFDLISSMPASHSIELPPKKCSTAYVSISERHIYPEGEFTNDLSSINFWHPGEIIEKEYYDCYGFPWGHTIMVAKNSRVIYHVVTETVRD